MPKRVRDYKAEYQRRVQRGEQRGLSRKAARGHAPDEVKGAKTSPARKRPLTRKSAPTQPRKRDYKAEYRRRLKRLEALGLSRSVARGHPRTGEVGAAERRQLRDAATSPSPGGWRLEDGTMTRGQPAGDDPIRKAAADRIAALLGMRSPVAQGRHELLRRHEDRKRFVEAACALGVTEQQAYTFWFSP